MNYMVLLCHTNKFNTTTRFVGLSLFPTRTRWRHYSVVTSENTTIAYGVIPASKILASSRFSSLYLTLLAVTHSKLISWQMCKAISFCVAGFCCATLSCCCDNLSYHDNITWPWTWHGHNGIDAKITSIFKKYDCNYSVPNEGCSQVEITCTLHRITHRERMHT